jgi:tRNA U34 5-methylaminomethyl-2-thiouridine-forming methyltransferase MnmC
MTPLKGKSSKTREELQLDHLQTIQTHDGSITFYNSQFHQTYHSLSGALDEALQKHVNVCHVCDNATILDYCFGLGYNSLIAMSLSHNLTIYALENDIELLAKLPQLSSQLPTHLQKLYTEMTHKITENLTQNKKSFLIKVNGHTIQFLIGDAQHTILQIPSNSCDALFWDPFSPKECPQLWTEKEFSQGFRILKSGGRLSTYSCARIVRENMKSAGFTVFDGPVVGRRSPATIGVKERT